MQTRLGKRTAILLLAGLFSLTESDGFGQTPARPEVPTPQELAAGFVPAETQFLSFTRVDLLANSLQQGENTPETQRLRDMFAKRFGDTIDHCRLLISGQVPPVTLQDTGDFPQDFTIAVFDRPSPWLGELQSGRTAFAEVTSAHGPYWKQRPSGELAMDFMSSQPAAINVVAFPEPNVCIVARESCLPRLLETHSSPPGETSAWVRRITSLTESQVKVVLLGSFAIDGLADKLGEIDFTPAIPALAEKLKLVQSAELAIEVEPKLALTVTLQMADGDDAADVSAAVSRSRQLGEALLPALRTRDNGRFVDLGLEALGKVAPESSETDVFFQVILPSELFEDAPGTLAEVLLSTQSALHSLLASKSERAAYLRDITEALVRYERRHGAFPHSAMARDANGQSLLSWRVHLLPELGHQELYDQFHLDEAWESEHNKALLEKMPNVFALCAGLPTGMTNAIAPSGQNSVLGHAEPVALTSLDDPTNTILVLEGSPAMAVPWTKPGDFVFDPQAKDAISQFGPAAFSVITVGVADGSCQKLDRRNPAEVLEQMFNFADGKPNPKFFGRFR